MKVGDLVSWYSDSVCGARPVQDHGIVTERCEKPGNGDDVYIHWVSGDGNGWFAVGHPSIGVVKRASR